MEQHATPVLISQTHHEPALSAYAELARAMKALSHPRRALIFHALADAGPSGLPFEGLRAATRLSVAALCHHMTPMLSAGLIRRRRKGAYVFHSLNSGPMLKAFAEVERGFTRAASRADPADA